MLGPGATLIISVAFKPTLTGPVTAQLVLSTDGSTRCAGVEDGAAPAGQCVVDLSAVGTPPGHLQVSSPAALTAPLGGSADASFTITNNGGSPVTITKSKPPIGAGFTATTRLDEGSVVFPGQVLTETVRFTPTAIGTSTGSWEITGDDGSGPRSVVVRGTATVPAGYVPQVYRDLLGRDPEPGGLAYWNDQLNGGTPLGQVAASIVTSREYEEAQVVGQYRVILRRDPDPAGLAYWADRLASGTHTPELQTLLGSSLEYFETQAGGDPGRFIDALYRDALGRGADPGGRSYYLSVLAAGTPRYTVAANFYFSDEALQRLITADYTKLLRRPPDQDGLLYWAARVQAGDSDQLVVVLIIASPEYVALAGGG